MNQYTVKEGMPEEEAEKLLRIVLFSDSLKLKREEEESRSLIRRRQKLAKTIREFRKRSVVPVFISLPWFLFSLVISIQLVCFRLPRPQTILTTEGLWTARQ
jgi:hypothetical protein